MLYGVAALALAGAAQAQTPNPPRSVAQKIAALNAACTAAGGKPAGGAYVFIHDFTGDGVNDWLVSEGNYNCAGRPNLLRPNGRAMVEIYATAGADAPRAFQEVVAAYRIVDARPRVVQIARVGAGCGPAAPGPCPVTLRWDAGTRRFVGSTAPAAGVAAAPPAKGATPAAGGVLNAAEVRSQIVGRRVEAEDGGMTWYYYPTGKYDADDGRNSRGGTYVVQPDGRLCWTENGGGNRGCFQYYRSGGKLQARRADPDNRFELGPVKVGPLE
jgi:hypothetical protein